MKNYEAPVCEQILLAPQDVIVTSDPEIPIEDDP